MDKMLLEQSHFLNRDVISILDFSKEELEAILDLAKEMKVNGYRPYLAGKVLASCFYEPSTRTRLSFESAALRLGARVIGFSDAATTSDRKGETLHDAMRIIGAYADLIVLRSPIEGSARRAAESTETPVINAGDGSRQHPTQTLLDLFTIQECQGSLDNLSIAIAGDLKYGRTVHSLVEALTYFKPRLYFASPPTLELPPDVLDLLKEQGIKYSFHRELDEILPKIDILYMTRLQKERFPTGSDDAHLSRKLQLTAYKLTSAKPTMRILHPLPRVDEISSDVDHTPHAYYFEQAANGLPVRAALLTLILGGNIS